MSTNYKTTFGERVTTVGKSIVISAAIFIAAFVFVHSAHASISSDGAALASYGSYTTSWSTPYTASGTDSYIVAVYDLYGGPVTNCDNIVGATYNGNAMTKDVDTPDTGDSKQAVFTLANGAADGLPHNITINFSTGSCAPLTLAIASYNGVDQSSVPEVVAHTAVGSGSAQSITITPLSNGAWVIGGATEGYVGVGASTTQRIGTTNIGIVESASNPINPATSTTLNLAYGNFMLTGLSLAPVGGGGGGGGSAPTISSLEQFKSDGATTTAEGATTIEDTVAFGATLNSSSTNQLRLEVEYTTSGSFTGVANATSSLVNPGSTSTAVAGPGLPDGNYRWRARAVDTVTQAASDWQEFGTPGNTDFVVHQVPLYTQVQSPFPSFTETGTWFGDTFANGAGIIGSSTCGLTIAKCGCAIASVVMNARYYGITSGIDNKDMTPKNINAWLETTSTGDIMNGYSALGDLKWDKGADYAVDSQIGLKLQHPQIVATTVDSTDLDSYLNQDLNSLEPAIIHSDSVGHFLVANSHLATTYSVRDPAFYLTKTLNDSVANTTTTHNYQNKFNSIHLYTAVPIATAIAQDLYLTMSSPAELLITDPNGNRLGTDPVSNTNYSEIGGAVYASEGISDGTVANPDSGHETKFAWIPNPVSGTYNVQVIGTASGTYTFEGLEYDASSTSHEQIFQGSTQTNLVTPYSLSYTPEQPSSIVVTSQIVFGGFLDPVKTDGSGLYKQGRTLPVKFQLTDASGTIITNHTAQLFVAKIQDDAVGTDEVALSSGSADSGNQFHVSGNQYVFNLDTGTLSVGTWQLKATLDDGTNHTVIISIKS